MLKGLNFLDVLLGELILDIHGLALLLVHLVEHLVHLGIVLQSVCVAQGVETVVCGGRAWRDAGDHDHLGLVLLVDEGISKD